MTDTTITCPNCGHEIALSEALAERIASQAEARLQEEYEARLVKAVAAATTQTRTELEGRINTLAALLENRNKAAREAEARELALRERALELERQQEAVADRVRLEAEERLRAQTAELLEQTRTHARKEAALELSELRRQLAEQESKILEARKRELEVERQSTELYHRQQAMELEIERRLAAARADEERRLRELIAAEESLKLAERDKTIADMRRVIEELKRKSEQGSQELQGEVLELDIEAALTRQFPLDAIAPVPKGISGADLIQEVRNSQGLVCGRIVWETKSTKHWQSAWLAKLKEDMRRVDGSMAVLVTTALPPGVSEFERIEGVWVASRRVWPSLAVALRETIVQVAFAHAAGEGKNEKMEAVYRYLAGDGFRQKVSAIVEAFTALQASLAQERRAMERIWKERERHIEHAITSAAGMYGDMRGIVGSSIAEIPALALGESEALLEEH